MVISRIKHTYNRWYYYLEDDDGTVLCQAMYWNVFRNECNRHGMTLPERLSELNFNESGYVLIDEKYGTFN